MASLSSGSLHNVSAAETKVKRLNALLSLGVAPSLHEELLSYHAGALCTPQHLKTYGSPLPDEPFVSTWCDYAKQVEAAGEITPMAQYLVQLQFPIRAGMSEDPVYLAATQKGILHTGKIFVAFSGVSWRDPHRIRLGLHKTLTGTLPFIVCEERDDFLSMVRALSRKNEPVPIPDSMGACFLSGYRNWHRLLHPSPASSSSVRFDRVVLLSAGFYSAVRPESLGLSAEEWRGLSLRIRLEHESIHYATKRLFGVMRNSLHDELLADSLALFLSTGAVRPDWLLYFFGLERYPKYRDGGRMTNYRGRPSLSDPALSALAGLVVRAIKNTAQAFRWVQSKLITAQALTAMLVSMAALSLEELALDDGAERIVQTLAALQNTPADYEKLTTQYN